MLNLSIDIIFIQTIGMPMGTHGAVLFADLKLIVLPTLKSLLRSLTKAVRTV
jgi:hypothetical protein